MHFAKPRAKQFKRKPKLRASFADPAIAGHLSCQSVVKARIDVYLHGDISGNHMPPKRDRSRCRNEDIVLERSSPAELREISPGIE